MHVHRELSRLPRNLIVCVRLRESQVKRLLLARPDTDQAILETGNHAPRSYLYRNLLALPMRDHLPVYTAPIVDDRPVTGSRIPLDGLPAPPLASERLHHPLDIGFVHHGIWLAYPDRVQGAKRHLRQDVESDAEVDTLTGACCAADRW